MARYAKVDVRVWDDEKVKRLSAIQPCGQGLWIRLLVSRNRTSIPGLMCVGEAALAEEFGWTLEGFREGFREVSQQGLAKADWKARLVWIPKAIKYNPPENPNVIKGWAVPWNEAPECPLKNEAYQSLKEYVKGLSKGFQEAFEKGCPNRLANQDPDPEQEPEQERKIPSRDPSTTEHVPRTTGTASWLIQVLRVAIEKAQPQAGMWNAGGQFAASEARGFLESFDRKIPEQEIYKRAAIFAADTAMTPWTVKKFVAAYNGIGQAKTATDDRLHYPHGRPISIDEIPTLQPIRKTRAT